MRAWIQSFGIVRVVSGVVCMLCLAMGCADTDEVDDESSNVHENALDDGGLGDDPKLCDRLSAMRGSLGKHTVVFGRKYNVIQGTDGADELTGTSAADLIFGG